MCRLPLTTGTCRPAARHSGKTAEVAGTANGATIVQRPYASAAHQQSRIAAA
ncbi:RICIN domain-containing protein [Actinoplanes sp. ATCC 53533]|uniref:RICIN domain-containing protein n=1 Tax=Actinoplanes sp. ATCC 53533 TaxID=1288362 RepID=UPI0011D14FB5|nr:RICIN domain-containing protein [Actinoplanes sp. ATCC 53533]